MNTYQETIAERKAMLSGARHKKNGSRSRKCTLPSDNLTPAQKRKLNGPVVTYAINRPMTYEEFKKMPRDLQQAHLDYIQNRFCVGLRTISSEVFGIGTSTLGTYCHHNGLTSSRVGGGRVANDDMEALKAWASREEEVPAEEVPAEEVPAEEETCTMQSFGFNLAGTPDAICKFIREAIAGMGQVEVAITVKNL